MIFAAWASQWKEYIASVPDVTDKVPVPRGIHDAALAAAAAQGVSLEDFLRVPDDDSAIGPASEPGDSCPTCGRRVPMTGKQRQKRWRERNG